MNVMPSMFKAAPTCCINACNSAHRSCSYMSEAFQTTAIAKLICLIVTWSAYVTASASRLACYLPTPLVILILSVVCFNFLLYFQRVYFHVYL